MYSGWWTIGSFRSAPIRLHWSVLIGALLFSGFHVEPALWLAFLLLILVHELGHAILVKAYRLHVIEIALHGMGGHCAYSPPGTSKQSAVIAWGGVLAQACLLAATVAATHVFGLPLFGPAYQFYYVFATVNVFVIFLNLLPFRPLDGANAWRLVPILIRQMRTRVDAQARVRRRREQVQEHLRVLDKAADESELDEEGRRLVRELIEKTTKTKR
ncbi:MAG TPA: hypothetical protein VGI10_02075 [Polyangiaceae bacterium]|jgi:Zn-dependent protease